VHLADNKELHGKQSNGWRKEHSRLRKSGKAGRQKMA